MMRQTAAHTDIRAHGWVARLPEGLRPYVLLARLDRPVGTWLLLLPGIWGIELAQGATPTHRAWLIALFAIGSLAMRSAGCVVNDIWDRKIDAQVARTAGRPLASGRLSVNQALVVLAALLAIGAFVLFQLPLVCWLLAPLALLLVGLYPAAKRVTWWPQLVMGFTFGFGAPMGYAASAGRVDWICALLYAGTICGSLALIQSTGFRIWMTMPVSACAPRPASGPQRHGGSSQAVTVRQSCFLPSPWRSVICTGVPGPSQLSLLFC